MTLLSPGAFSSNEYDFLIVGGGTSGLVLSSRLSENPAVTVGIIEAGGDNSHMDNVNVPGMAGRGIGDERLDWKFQTIKQVEANDREIACPRGKGIGGSSAINFMVYSRANTAEYDAFESLGNDGWNCDVYVFTLILVSKAETFTGPSEDIKGSYHIATNGDAHGFGGPLKISYSHWYNELHLRFIDTLVNLGIPVNKDPTSGDNTGASTGMFTIDPALATRTSAANASTYSVYSCEYSLLTYSRAPQAYYSPNADRPNLQLLPDSQVTRVLLDLVDGEYVAKGVEFFTGNKKYTVHAKREVILCCGSFQSPMVLELSGIGTSKVLGMHDIPQLIDLPVGENLQDHSWVPFVHEVDKNVETLDKLMDPNFPDFFGSQRELYDQQKRGMLSGSFSGYAYIPLNSMMEPDALSQFLHDVENDTTLAGTEGLQMQFNFLKEWFRDPNHPQLEVLQFPVFKPLNEQLVGKNDPSCRYQTLVLVDLHPLSRGSVHISSSNPTHYPRIDPGFLRNPRDVDVLMNSVRFAHKLLKTAPYNDSKPALYDPPQEIIEDDEKLRAWIRTRVGGLYHPVGTCSMLPKKYGGVVDPSLLVYGTKNLRVADASIIPLELSTHIQSSVYGIAEKAADIVKRKHGL
ncbi:GMC oxidoreductase [Peniophora sp. CONT]|nr:GMC oxidoreductase [Peniophora sp. CONT]